MSAGIIDGSVATDADGINSLSAALRVEVDSKAMRKLEIDMGIYAVLETLEVGSSASMQWMFNCRTLIKLP